MPKLSNRRPTRDEILSLVPDLQSLLLKELEKEHPVVDKIKAIINLGINANTRDTKTHYTALMKASLNGHIEAVKVLIMAGADVNSRDKHNSTALMMASGGGHIEIVELLIKMGSKIDIQNTKFASYSTAVNIAIFRGYIKIVKLLIEAGADLNIRDFYCCTVLSKIRQLPSYNKTSDEMMELIIQHGAV